MRLYFSTFQSIFELNLGQERPRGRIQLLLDQDEISYPNFMDVNKQRKKKERRKNVSMIKHWWNETRKYIKL